MTWVIFRLTLRQLLGQRRAVLVALFAAIPVVIAVVYRFGDHTARQEEFTAKLLLGGLVVGSLLPLAAVVFGTAALGSEIEDGTAVYLLSKPIARWEVVAGKFLAAWTITAAVVFLSTMLAGSIALYGAGDQQLVPAFAFAAALGAALYAMVFIALSIYTSRALIVGLTYVFLWEGLVTGLFQGTRLMSVRQYTLGIADALSHVSKTTFDADLAGTSAAIGMALAAVLATVLAVRRLERFEIGESG